MPLSHLLTLKMSPEVRQTFRRHLTSNYEQCDRVFGYLLPLQWLFLLICALTISPRAWEGAGSSTHAHVWAAVFLGGLITAFPLAMTWFRPSHSLTRYLVSANQAFFSALIIHLMAGRIEAHFPIFVSLGLLACYRDRSVFLPMVLLTAVDHLARGFLWPMSIFGTEMVVPWRAFEHAAWVVFMTGGLMYLVRQSLSQMVVQAELETSLKHERDQLDSRVNERTAELDAERVFQQSVLDSIDAQICILDNAGTILFVNQRWKDFVTNECRDYEFKTIGHNYLAECDRVQGECRKTTSKVAEAIREIADGQREHFSIDYELPHGERKRWFHIRVNPVPHQGQTAVAVVHVDVTKLKTAQARADALARLVMESPHELFVISQENLRFLEVNAGATENLGYTAEELRQMTPAELAVDYNESDMKELMQQVEAAKGKAIEFESRHQRKDGTTYDCSISLSTATFQGQPVYVAFVTDVTERSQLENRLRQAQKLESMGQLAAGIAHEINTPMQCVFSNVEFLQQAFQRMLQVTDRFAEVLDAHQVDWEQEREELQAIRKKCRYDYVRKQAPMALEEATEASQRVISIVRAMKVMSHPGTVQKTPTDLNDLIENATTITRNRWKYVAEIVTELDPQLNSVDLLPAEMSQVFINMLVNAADSIGEKLGPEPDQLGRILVATRKKGNTVEIEVSDSGTGISNELKSRIFDPFFTTKDVGKGTGQGLAITYDVIVNKHGGAIDLESTVGQGASFFLTIPLVETAAAAPLEADAAMVSDQHTTA